MTVFPVFLSVVLVVRNQSRELNAILADTTNAVAPLVVDYEFLNNG